MMSVSNPCAHLMKSGNRKGQPCTEAAYRSFGVLNNTVYPYCEKHAVAHPKEMIEWKKKKIEQELESLEQAVQFKRDELTSVNSMTPADMKEEMLTKFRWLRKK